MEILLFNSILLGIGLAMDAFSVSLANGIHEPFMNRRKMCLIAGTFGFFQFLMPLLGWLGVNGIADLFQVIWSYVPWISLFILTILGLLMIKEGITGEEEAIHPETGCWQLMVQAIATSMDALSVGFTIACYKLEEAIFSSIIIGIVTFILCLLGILFGRQFGMKLADRATIVGGIILIFIGVEIFLGN